MGIDEHWELIMRNRSKTKFYIVLALSIICAIFVLSKIFPYSSNYKNYYDDVSIEDTSKLALYDTATDTVLHCVAAEMLIPTMHVHTHNNTKYCYV